MSIVGDVLFSTIFKSVFDANRKTSNLFACTRNHIKCIQFILKQRNSNSVCLINVIKNGCSNRNDLHFSQTHLHIFKVQTNVCEAHTEPCQRVHAIFQMDSNVLFSFSIIFLISFNSICHVFHCHSLCCLATVSVHQFLVLSFSVSL